MIYWSYMNITTIIALLQVALSLLSSVQSNPNLSEEIRQQAIDFSHQAVELATDAVTALAVNPIDESGNVLGSVPLAPVPPVAQVHATAPDEFPTGIFTVNGNALSVRDSSIFARGNKNIFLTRQQIPDGEMDFSWNISQKDGNALNCSIESENQIISKVPQGNVHIAFGKYRNIIVKCSDSIANSYTSFYIEVIK